MLVGVYKEPEQKEEFESLLAELDSLVDTLEIPVIVQSFQVTQRHRLCVNHSYKTGINIAASLQARL